MRERRFDGRRGLRQSTVFVSGVRVFPGLVEKFLKFYKSRRFIVFFTSERH
jgi:hypothetical protein